MPYEPRNPAGSPAALRFCVPSGASVRRLMAGRAFHAAIHLGREVVVGAKLPWLVAAVDADAFRRARRMIGEQQRKQRQALDVLERALGLRFLVARRVGRPRFL